LLTLVFLSASSIDCIEYYCIFCYGLYCVTTNCDVDLVR